MRIVTDLEHCTVCNTPVEIKTDGGELVLTDADDYSGRTAEGEPVCRDHYCSACLGHHADADAFDHCDGDCDDYPTITPACTRDAALAVLAHYGVRT